MFNFGSFTGGLFDKPTSGLFGKSSDENKSDATPKLEGGLFSKSKSSEKGSSIFNFEQNGVPPVKNEGFLFGKGSDQEGDSDNEAEL